jgi:hypothetical protein
MPVMRTTIKNIALLLLFTTVINTSNLLAQTAYFAVDYTIGFPSGNTKDFIKSASFRGITFEYRNFIENNVSIGIDGGWQIFYERRPFATYTRGNESVSGVQFRYQNVVPLFAAADYYFGDDEIRPYVGLGIGTLYSHQRVDMGLFSLEDKTWHFALRPEAGVLIEANIDLDFIMTARYIYGFEASGVSAQQYFSFNVGAAFRIW